VLYSIIYVIACSPTLRRRRASRYTFLVFNSCVIALLLAPLPSNAARGLVLNTVKNTWDKSSYLRNTCYLLCLLNAVMFSSELRMQRRHWYAESSLYDEVAHLRNQRDSIVSGFGLFTFFIAARLVNIQTKLHDSRKAAKGADADKKVDKKES